jgi:hypothetical protein
MNEYSLVALILLVSFLCHGDPSLVDALISFLTK